jgi:hypothetical protein
VIEGDAARVTDERLLRDLAEGDFAQTRYRL